MQGNYSESANKKEMKRLEQQRGKHAELRLPPLELPPSVPARATPHGVDRVGKSISVPFGDRRVSPLRTDMPVRTVAEKAEPAELIT